MFLGVDYVNRFVESMRIALRSSQAPISSDPLVASLKHHEDMDRCSPLSPIHKRCTDARHVKGHFLLEHVSYSSRSISMIGKNKHLV